MLHAFEHRIYQADMEEMRVRTWKKLTTDIL